jgi:hypothetical protein
VEITLNTSIQSSSRKGRRNYPIDFKRQLAIAACAPVVSVARLALIRSKRFPTDWGKGGVERSMLADGWGLPMSIAVAATNGHDMKLCGTERPPDKIGFV